VGESLQRSDKRFLLACVPVVAFCCWYTWHNYTAAFPQASIDLRYSRDQITRIAARFLDERKLSTAGFRNLTLFDPDENARLYLEREAGLEEANRLMQREVPVWRWRARWIRPPHKEELVVQVSPDGRVVGFEHQIEEAAPGARLAMEAARALADQFLRRRTASGQRLIEEQLQERPNRWDYVFTWEQEGFRAREATYRRSVTIQGDQVGSYEEFLHVPEQWERDFAALRSKNELYTQIAQAFYLPLMLAALAVLIQALRRRQVRWRPLVLGSAVVGGLMVINEWNGLPFFIDRMPTSSSYRDSILIGLLQGLGAGVGIFFYVILAAAPGEYVYRASLPGRLSLPAALSWRGIRTREFLMSSAAGYAFAAAHIAFVVAFYLIGRKFGVWSPQDVEYSDLLSTAVPWIYPLTISLLAASSEEFWFRLLAVPLLARYLRMRWLAVLIPAFVWGFLHANYPQQPGYIRGIEVGLIGVAAGYLMLRFGILATLIWHYTVDAVLIGVFLLQAESWYFRISGLLVAGAVLFPLAAAAFLYRRHGCFLVDPGMLNTAEAPPEAASDLPAEAEPADAGEPWQPRWNSRRLYVAAAGAAAVLLVPAVRYGDYLRVHLSSGEAAARAVRSLAEKPTEKTTPPASWRRVTVFTGNLHVPELEYLRRQAGSDAATQAVRDRTQTGVWRTRFFRPQEKEELWVYLDAQGRVWRTDHVLGEKAPGARLAAGAARALAEKYLTGVQRLPLEDYRLVDSTEEKRDRRTDHGFVWEDRRFRLGEATARVSVSVIGDEVSHYRRFLKLPEEWLRQFHRPRLQSFVLPGIAGSILLVLLVVLLWRLGGRAPPGGEGHHFHWRAYAALTGVSMAAVVLESANGWSAVLLDYDTARPLVDYVWEILLGRVVWVLLLGTLVFLGALALDVFLQLALGRRRAPRPSLVRAAAVAVVIAGLGRAQNVVQAVVPGDRLSLPMWSIAGVDTLVPAVTVLAGSFFSAITVVLIGGILMGAAASLLSPRKKWLVTLALAAAMALSGSTNPWQWIFHFAAALLVAALAVFLIRTCGADLATFGVALFWLNASAGAWALISQQAAALRWNGAAALLVAALVGLVVLARSGRATPAPRQ